MANYNSNSGSRFIDGIVVGGEVYAESNIYLPEASATDDVVDKGQIYFGDLNSAGGYDFKIGTRLDNTGIIEQNAPGPLCIQVSATQQGVAHGGNLFITTDASSPQTNENFIASFAKSGVQLGHAGTTAMQTKQRSASYTTNSIPYPLGIGVLGSYPNEDYKYTLDSFVETGSVTFATANTSGYEAQIGLRDNTTIPHSFAPSLNIDNSRSLNFNIDNAADERQGYFSWSISSDDYSPGLINDNPDNSIVGDKIKYDIMRLYQTSSTFPGYILDFRPTKEHPDSPKSWSTLQGGEFDGEVVNEYLTTTIKATFFKGMADTVAALTGRDTDDLVEGDDNLYFSDSRARSAISLTTGEAVEGGSLSYVNGAFTYSPVKDASVGTVIEDNEVTIVYEKGIASFAASNFSTIDGHITLNVLENSDISSNANIVLSKLEDIAGNTLLGNNLDTDGDVNELTPAQARTLLNVEDGADNYSSFNVYSGKAGYYEDSSLFDGVNSDTFLYLNEELHSLQATSGTNMIFVPGGGIEISTALVQNEGLDDTILIGVNTNATDTTYTGNGDYGIIIEEEIDIRLKDDRRRNSDNARILTGNTSEYIAFNPNVLDLNDPFQAAAGPNNPIINSIQFFTDKVEEMRLLGNGDLHVNGDIVGFSNTISDERLKENIKTVDNALDKVSQLNGVTFDWERNGAASAGLIAQDLEAVLPSAVKEQPLPLHAGNELYKTVEYSQVTALLIEAIKELKEQNTQLRADIEELKNINTSK